MIAVMAHSLDGNDKQAAGWADIVRRRKPDASQTQFFESFPFSDPKSRELISSALARYGL
jgi:hypothetical protein